MRAGYLRLECLGHRVTPVSNRQVRSLSCPQNFPLYHIGGSLTQQASERRRLFSLKSIQSFFVRIWPFSGIDAAGALSNKHDENKILTF
jgi:hypothetical protein